MTAQRRSRNGANGRKRQRQRQTQQRQRSQSTSDEASTDEGSTTRCLCGETHNIGLMVQCDKCEVWQHCECVGLAEQDIPEQYYCEECKPENHASLKSTNGRTRRSYSSDGKPQLHPVDKKPPKKRMTMNSQEASLSLEDVLAVRQALGFNQSNNNSSKSPSTSPTMDFDDEIQESMHTGKRKRDDISTVVHDESKVMKHQFSSTSTMSDVASEQDGTSKMTANNDGDHGDSALVPAQRITKSKRNTNGRLKVVTLDEDAESNSTNTAEGKTSVSNTKASEKRGRQSNNNNNAVSGRRNNNTANGNTRRQNNNKPRSRTSTPQPSECPLTSSIVNGVSLQHDQSFESQQQDNSPCSTNVGSVLLSHFSAESRAASPPAKVRYPTSRMSISEMNRRAKQILEYISSIQVEMANKSTGFNKANSNIATTTADGKNNHNSNNDFENDMTESSGRQIGTHPAEVPEGINNSNNNNNNSSSSSSNSNSAATDESSRGDDSIGAGTERRAEKQLKRSPTAIVIPDVRYEDGPSSSLSSASTIPLDEGNLESRLTELDDHEPSQAEDAISKNRKLQKDETSLEIMDMLTRELIKFQRKFGSGSYSHHRRMYSHPDNQPPSTQEEGRVTRSANNGNGLRLVS